jgi:hypothetical protein
MEFAMAGFAPNVGSVNTIMELKNIDISSAIPCPTILVEGYGAPGDGGGGEFRWVGDPATDDGGLVINPAMDAAKGHWQRVYDGGAINCRWFGVLPPAAASDNTTAIQKIIDAGGPLYVPPGDYGLNTVILKSGTRIRSDGRLLGTLSTPHQTKETPFQVTGAAVNAKSGKGLNFTSGGSAYTVKEGDTITGATSHATAVVKFVLLTAGSWATGDAAGIFWYETSTGTFGVEELNVGANLSVAAAVPVAPPSVDSFNLAVPYQYPSPGAVNTAIEFIGSLSGFAAGQWIVLSLIDAGSDGNGLINQRGYDFLKIQSIAGQFVTFDRPTRMGFPTCKMQRILGIVQSASGAQLSRYDQSITGDFTAAGLAVGDIIHIENLNGTDTPWTLNPGQGVSNNAYRCYFERSAVRAITSSLLTLEDECLYDYTDFLVIKPDFVRDITIEGGYVTKLQINDAQNVTILNLAAQDTSFFNVYGGSVTLLNGDGNNAAGVVRTIGFTFCSNMVLTNLRARSTTSSSDNGATKMLGCSRMDLSGLRSYDTTATVLSESAFFVDFYYTPYSLWSQSCNYRGLVLGRPKGALSQTSAWISATRDCIVSEVNAMGSVRLSRSVTLSARGIKALSILAEVLTGCTLEDVTARFINVDNCAYVDLINPKTTGANGANNSRLLWIKNNSTDISVYGYRGLSLDTEDVSVWVQNAIRTRIVGGSDQPNTHTSIFSFGSGSPLVYSSISVFGGNWSGAISNVPDTSMWKIRGDLQLTYSAFDRDRIVLNDTYLFRDATGQLRTKSGSAPSSATDGLLYATIATGSGTPVGNRIPAFIGQLYVDTAGKNSWIAVGTANTDWKQTTP